MRARNVMTTEVVTAHPDAPVQALAKLMAEYHISGLPVVDEARRLVGALAVTVRDNTRGRQRDHHMRDRVLAKFSRLPWGIPSEGNVIVTAGVVHVWGYLPSSAEVDVLRVVAEGIRGVKGFQDHTYRYFGDVSVRNHTRSEVTLVGPVVTRPTNTDITSCAGSAQRPFRS